MKSARRSFAIGFFAIAASASLVLSGCSTSTTPSGDAAGTGSAGTGAFPVTLQSALGDVTIEQQPQRVATVSWVNDDVALALGVVPVAMPTTTWGGDENGLTPWKAAKLDELGASLGSDNAPTLYPEESAQINFDEIAKAQPDVILAAYSGLNQESYDKLAKIAPVVGYPEKPYGTSWQDSTRLIGQALGKNTEAENLINSTQQAISDKVQQFPQLAGKTFIAGNIEAQAQAGVSLYTPQDNRPRLLTEMGMTMAPVAAQATQGSDAFFVDWSREKANELDSDLFMTWLPDGMTAETLKNDPLIGQIPAIRNGGLVATEDKTLSLSFSAASPLSIPWMLDSFVPQLAAAVDASAASSSSSN
ncbi:iron-siderophore ABC transporter substrate-binding protein [Acaricomes phytoseiuli]|uniref:iron-siderophore ABC transporter substrate-binding protein n=1 Tax=Acaricomes phytoseiuli TaxID=291968 RepID=UPI00035D828A|nr:iron-siderophore ABC transporter substrate-binding protein [Acaricomes phytoseiuli]MCW1250488.1 iron-siderophore ABC transporter substrate-binding protein [Acaricomes phytoseiuli]